MQGWVIITTYALSIVEVGSIQFCNNNFATIESVEVVLVWYSHCRRYFRQVLTWVRKLIFSLIMIIKVGRNHNINFIHVVYIYVYIYDEFLYHDLSIQIEIHTPQTLLADVGFYGTTIKIWLISSLYVGDTTIRLRPYHMIHN